MRRKRPPTRYLRLGRDRLLAHAVEDLQRDGWEVYKRGFPTLAAVKDCQMRLIVVHPLVTYEPVVLGSGKDALSEAFYKCFGVKYEVWENPEPDPEPKSWM